MGRGERKSEGREGGGRCGGRDSECKILAEHLVVKGRGEVEVITGDILGRAFVCFLLCFRGRI